MYQDGGAVQPSASNFSRVEELNLVASIKIMAARVSILRFYSRMLKFAKIAIPLCIFAMTASASDELSGGPTMNATYAARNPRVCTKLTKPPTLAQAKALVQCNLEGMFPGPSLVLVTDVDLEMGAVRNQTPLDQTNDSDPRSKIYPLRGSLTRYACSPAADYPAGANCQKWPAAVGGNAPGKCWQTSFGNWECTLTGGSSNQFIVKLGAGPKSY